jgi:sugar transferase (PEP-CTERM/EpsH1 system associated)
MQPPPPLICHVIYRLTIGGLENGLVNLVNNLPEDRWRHAIVCVSEATEFRSRIRRPNVEIHELKKRPGKDFAAYQRMWRVVRQLKPRIVHTRNLPALDMMVPAYAAGAPRFVHSEHGFTMMEIDGKNRKYNRLRRLSRLVVDRYVALSRDLHDWLRDEIRVSEARLTTIYNGVDTDRFTPQNAHRDMMPPSFAPPGAVVIGTLGRLEPVKNQLALVRAFARVLALRPQLRATLRLAVIGGGEQQAEVEAAIASANLGDLVWLPGFRNDTPQLYRALDIFALPSLREGISNTLLEAMASGRPVIATRVGGNPEIVPEGIAGQLVAPDPEELAAAILNYVENPALMRAHGAGGRAHVLRSFSLEAMVRNYDRVYGSLL